MPIRMTDDPNEQQQENYDDGGGSRRQPGFPGNTGGGGGLSLLPMLLSLFRGKGIIFLLIIGAALYFLLGKGNCNVADIAQTLFSQSGYSFNPREFEKASIYEGLEDDNSKNPLPESVSLLRFAPDRLNQGEQGSCVAWSSAYAARTILESASTGVNPNQIRFSPSFMYNQIGLDGCQGSYLQRAMDQMSRQGALPLNQFPYTDQDCSQQPNSQQIQNASRFRIRGFTRLTNGDNMTVSPRAVKEHLAKDAPVVIGMMVGNSFMQGMVGQEVWVPQGMDQSQMGMGGHAMCVIGYDDRKYGGAFQIMNSWGPEWGKNGIGWVRYADFSNYVREAYGIDALPKQGEMATIPLECNIGLVDNATKQYIQLRSTGGNTYNTVTPIRIGTRFKVEVKNATECYIYIFGQESDGTSFVLFPYLKQGETVSKHSPYCGITGYRLFPRAQSLEADNIGNKDYIAIVTSKTALDYNKLNAAISSSTQSTYAGKVNQALSSMLSANPGFSNAGGGTIYFKTSSGDNKAVAAIVSFDKN